MVYLDPKKVHLLLEHGSPKEIEQNAEMLLAHSLKEHLVGLFLKSDELGISKDKKVEYSEELLAITLSVIEARQKKQDYPIVWRGRGQIMCSKIAEILDLYKFIS